MNSTTTEVKATTTGGLFGLPSNPFDESIDWDAVAASLVTQIAGFGGRLLWALFILVVGWIVISWVIRPILNRVVGSKKLDHVVGRFIVIVVTSLLKILLVSTCVGVLGVEQLSIAAFVAFFGIGVGQGVSGIVKDFIAGLLLVVQRPIRHGDWIISGAGEGEVLRVGLTHTTLITSERQHEIVPNSALTSNLIRNYNSEPVMRVHHAVTVRHTEDLRLCREIFLELCATDPRILPHPAPRFIVSEIGLHGIKLSLRPYVQQEDFWAVYFDLPQAVKWQFERYGVRFQIERIEVEMTPSVPEVPEDVPPDTDDNDTTKLEDDDLISLAACTLEEKWRRNSALPSLSKRTAKAARSERIVDADLDDETDNLGDIEHYAPKVRQFDYRTARPSFKDRQRLHALAARWTELVSDIEEAERRKHATDNVVRAAKSRWRKLRRKLLKRRASTTSSADESKKLERLRTNTKQTLVGLGQLQSKQHDRELVERVSSQLSPRRKHSDDDIDVDDGEPTSGKQRARSHKRTAVRRSPRPSVDAVVDAVVAASSEQLAPINEDGTTVSAESARPGSTQPTAAARSSSAMRQSAERRATALPPPPKHAASTAAHAHAHSAHTRQRRLRRTFSADTIQLSRHVPQSLAPSDEESSEPERVTVVQVDEDALATLDNSGERFFWGGA